MVLGHPAAHDVHPGHALDPQEPRIEVVAGLLPEFGDVPRLARQADADDREGGEGEPVDGELGRGRQRAADLGKPAQDVEFGLDHVGGPVEEDVDGRRASAGRRADVGRAGDVLHRLFDGPSDRGHHLVGRHHAVVDEDHDARKIGLRKDRRRHYVGGIAAGQTQGRREEENCLPMTKDEGLGRDRTVIGRGRSFVGHGRRERPRSERSPLESRA